MLIAIPSEAPGGLDAPISAHFGHCAAFTLVHLDDGKIGEVKVVDNGEHQEGGCLAPVMALKELAVDVLLTGGMGRRPLAGFHDVGIAVHSKEGAATVREGVALFLEGKCPEFEMSSSCGGGGHCGHHHEEPPRPPIEGKADVRRGRLITLDFELKTLAGDLVDASARSGPMRYLQGSGVIASLEKAIDGLEAGARTSVQLAPSECFGERDERRVNEVPLDQLPSGIGAGDVLTAVDPHGRQFPITVVSVGDKTAQLDGNHPLAGKTVVFDLCVVKVESALPEELAELPDEPAELPRN